MIPDNRCLEPCFPWHQLSEGNDVMFWIASDCHVLIHPLHDFRMQGTRFGLASLCPNFQSVPDCLVDFG